MPNRSPQMLVRLLESREVVELEDLRTALGGGSDATVFRHIKRIPYRSSYNHNGRYYALHDPTKYDRWGLHSVGDIHFSVDGTLKATVVRLVCDSEAGCTQKELQDLLRVRVQSFLLTAVRAEVIARERVGRLYVYLHCEGSIREAQLCRRRERLVEVGQEEEVDEEVTIRVLLILLRYPGSQPGDVARRLKGRSPPVSRAQVDSVFTQYGLGEKGGPWIY
jgi:hypothetical protein